MVVGYGAYPFDQRNLSTAIAELANKPQGAEPSLSDLTTACVPAFNRMQSTDAKWERAYRQTGGTGEETFYNNQPEPGAQRGSHARSPAG
jgi:hypothetical protein